MDELLDLIAQAMEAPTSSIDEDSSSLTIGKWDSLRQVVIGNMLEQHYGVMLDDRELSDLGSVASIRAILRGHGITSAVAARTPASPTAVSAPVPEHLTFASLRHELGRAPSVSRIFDVADRLNDPAVQAGYAGATPRVAIVGSLTIDFLAAAVACAALQENALARVYKAPFASTVQEVLDPSSGLYRFHPDVVVLTPDWRDAVADLPIGVTPEAVEAALADQVAKFGHLWATLRERTGAKIIQHLLVPPTQAYCGLAERHTQASPANQVAALNARLIAAAGNTVTWVEMDRLAELHGRARFAASRFYFSSKLPFDPQFLPDYLQAFRAAWRIANGRVKKVLALDLDNTLWGGVIGDDGVAGIRLGPDTPAGEAFADWGAYCKQLAARGVILAACSKNDPKLAAEGFEHAHSALKQADFAAFEVSWDDKVAGLRRIAATLNLGIDSIVFADDNPFECDLVRQNLPEVAVVELGTDPSAFIGLLDAGHWFDLPVYTAEDLARSQSYQGRRAAEAARENATDIGSYLAGLEMVGDLYAPGQADLDRLAQMEKKTNQFNMTTRRYDAGQIAALMTDDTAMVLAFKLRDRHADHGLIASLIAHGQGETLEIDSWLMSCRVFSRGAEEFMMNGVVTLARDRGYARIVGEYQPTAKNNVVADLYLRLGFAPLDNNRWELLLSDARAGSAPTYIAASGQLDVYTADPAPEASSDVADNPAEALRRLEGLVAAGLLEEADAFAVGAIVRHPDQEHFAFEAARVASRRQDWPRAIERWARLREVFPDREETYVQGSDALVRAGAHARAEPLVEALQSRFPNSVWGHLLQAELLYRRGDAASMAARAREVADRFPASADVLQRLTLLLREAGEVTALRHVLGLAQSAGIQSPILTDAWASLGERPGTVVGTANLPPPGVRTLVVYGSCQAAMLGGILRTMLSARDDLEVYVILAHEPEQAARISEQRLRNAVLCWEQFDDRPSVPMRDKLRDSLPANCPILSYPLLSMHSLWPFDWPEPVRNLAEPPRFPFGRFPYGDSIGIAVAKEGLRGAAAFSRYMELSAAKMPNNEVLFARGINAIRKREAGCHVKMADFLQSHTRQERLFYTWGHPTLIPIREMARQLLPLSASELKLPREGVAPMLDALVPWESDIMVPIHPLVIDRLGLAFTGPDQVYRWQGQRWTFEEYTIHYIENGADW